MIFGQGCLFYDINFSQRNFSSYEVHQYQTPTFDVGCTHLPEYGVLYEPDKTKNMAIIAECKTFLTKTECLS